MYGGGKHYDTGREATDNQVTGMEAAGLEDLERKCRMGGPGDLTGTGSTLLTEKENL